MRMNSKIKDTQEGMKAIRLLLDVSQTQLGDFFGITKQSISNLENNRCRLSKAQAIAFRVFVDRELTKVEESDLRHVLIKKILPSLDDICGEEIEDEQMEEQSVQ